MIERKEKNRVKKKLSVAKSTKDLTYVLKILFYSPFKITQLSNRVIYKPTYQFPKAKEKILQTRRKEYQPVFK